MRKGGRETEESQAIISADTAQPAGEVETTPCLARFQAERAVLGQLRKACYQLARIQSAGKTHKHTGSAF